MNQPTREEYELAAKAAGYGCDATDLEFVYIFQLPVTLNRDGEQNGSTRWDPRHDDGDSRRLQVACGICLSINNTAKEVHVTLDWMQEYPSSSKQGTRPIPQACGIYSFEGYNNDRYEAARHAVFKLAVEIGRDQATLPQCRSCH